MFSLTNSPIDPSKLREALISPESGGIVTFEGIVRNHSEGQAVQALSYEAFDELCVKEAEKILAESRVKFSIISVRAVHRSGDLKVGDIAVWVGVSAAHRDAAFAACRYVIDEIKARLPIWKKEFYVSGDSGWVNCALPTDKNLPK